MPAQHFIDLTFEQVKQLDPATVAVLPLGAIEQHGPHLPVSTDYLIASSVAEAAAALISENAVEGAEGVHAVLLPGLAYTKSDEHHWAPGTIWVSWDTLMNYLIDIGRSLANTPIKKLMFVNGHGGNSALGQVVCRELHRRFGLETFFAHSMAPVDQSLANASGTTAPHELGLGIHGGHTETAVVMHLRPELVNMDLAERQVPEHLTEYQHVGFGKRVSFGWCSDDFETNGAIGDPTGATAEAGKLLFEAAAVSNAEAIVEVAQFRFR